MQEDLEKTIKKRILPIIDEASKRFLGFSIEKLNENLIDKLEKPIFRFTIDTSIPYKKAKRLFKKEFFSKLLKGHFGNISEVARVSGLDRRSVHRAVKELKIDIDDYRRKGLVPDEYNAEKIDEAVKHALEDFSDIIRPAKLEEIYKNVSQQSQKALKDLPLREATYEEAEEEWEREYFKQALKENNNSVTKTAKAIGLRYETLIRKMKFLGI